MKKQLFKMSNVSYRFYIGKIEAESLIINSVGHRPTENARSAWRGENSQSTADTMKPPRIEVVVF